jgi:hypothetical protein
MDEIENQFQNVDEAKRFISSCGDPVVREVLWKAYSILTLSMAPHGPAGRFDVLFFARVLAEMLKDRDRLARVLSGDLTDE